MENKTTCLVAPYYHFFGCAPQMFRDYRSRCVFEYLFAVWADRFRKGEIGPFQYTVHNISIQANVNRAGVAKALEELVYMGLVLLDGEMCSVQASYFFAVVRLYSNAKSRQRSKIKAAFIQRNICALQELGLEEFSADLVQDTVDQISTGVTKQDRKSCINQATFEESCINQATFEDGGINQATLEDRKSCINQATFEESCINQATFEESCINQATFEDIVENLLACTSPTGGIIQATLEEKSTNSMSFLNKMYQKNALDITEEEKNRIVESILEIGVSSFLLQVAKSIPQDSEIHITGWVDLCHRNKRKKENKKETKKERSKERNKERNKERKKMSEGERSESSYRGGEEEKDFESSGGLEIVELVDPVSERERYRRYKEERKYRNPYRNKPYFSEKVIERITGDIEACIKSPVKLLIYNLWGGLYDWYQEETECNLPVDEYGEPLQEGESNDLDMLGVIVPEEMLAKLLKQAWYETEGQIECKFFQLEKGSIPLEIDELPEIRLEHLMDWKPAISHNQERGFVISLKGFRNIEENDVIEVKQARGREEIKAMNLTNRQMIATILSMDDSQLTPIEAAIKDFANKFILLNEYFHFERFLDGDGERLECHELPGHLIKPWTVRLIHAGISQEDFYSTFNLPGEYKDGQDLQPMATNFSYQKVQRWNEMNGFKSQLTPEKLKEAVLERKITPDL